MVNTRKTGFLTTNPIAYLGLIAAVCVFAVPSRGQIRGVYPVGMSATNSGVTPESGFTYANLFILYARDELKGPNGEVLATGQNSIIMDMNSFVFVSKKKIRKLGGAVFSFSATLPIANNSLTSDVEGALSGGGGFADSFYQPFILGWRTKRADIRAAYGFLAPTGRFGANANNNVGSGYCTQTASAGETFYRTKNKATAVSAFQMYEFHTTQQGTNIHPGQNFDLDYSVTQVFSLQEDLRLQLGFVGYGQWQTTDKIGPTITAAQPAAHYRVNALGFSANVILPARKASLGVKYFREFENRSTFQGYSLQISGSITF
ncbi:MAG: transporter [Candidatus Acidiferrales bacterium]